MNRVTSIGLDLAECGVGGDYSRNVFLVAGCFGSTYVTLSQYSILSKYLCTFDQYLGVGVYGIACDFVDQFKTHPNPLSQSILVASIANGAIINALWSRVSHSAPLEAWDRSVVLGRRS